MDIISQVIEEQREYFKCHRDIGLSGGAPSEPKGKKRDTAILSFIQEH